jgi:hypothetical protein
LGAVLFALIIVAMRILDAMLPPQPTRCSSYGTIRSISARNAARRVGLA